MSKSQTKLVPPRAKYVDSVCRHVPGILGSHCLAIGWHAIDSKKTKIVWLMTTIAMVTYMIEA